jgi:hypothetical protein
MRLWPSKPVLQGFCGAASAFALFLFGLWLYHLWTDHLAFHIMLEFLNQNGDAIKSINP